MIKYLSQWIKHNVAIMSDRSFPNNPVELKVLMISTLIMDLVLNIRTKKNQLPGFTEWSDSAYSVSGVQDKCLPQSARAQSVSAVTETLSDIDARERAAAFTSCKKSIAFISESTLFPLVQSGPHSSY